MRFSKWTTKVFRGYFKSQLVIIYSSFKVLFLVNRKNTKIINNLEEHETQEQFYRLIYKSDISKLIISVLLKYSLQRKLGTK